MDDRVDVKIDVESVIDADGPMQPKQTLTVHMSHFGLNLQRNFCDAYLYANFDIFILSLGLFKK